MSRQLMSSDGLNNFLKSLMAGLSISIGGYAFLMTDNRRLGALLFSIGLFLVCSMGYNLFTGKICYLHTGYQYTVGFMVMVLCGNFISTFIMGKITRLLNPKLIEVANDICGNKLAEGWRVVLLGIFCNLLIYYAVENYNHQTDRITANIGVIFCVVIFIICGFEHCVANMYYFSVADFNPACIWYLALNVVGNAIGGIGIGWLEKEVLSRRVSK